MTVISYANHATVVETAEARIARIAGGVMDACVFVPVGQTTELVPYSSVYDRIVVDYRHDPFGIRVEDAKAIVEAVRDSPRVGDRKKVAVEGVCNWISHILYRGFGVAAHDRRVAYRAALIRAVR